MEKERLDTLIEAMEMVARKMSENSEYFNNRAVAKYFGEQGVAIEIIARTLSEVLSCYQASSNINMH